MLVILSAFLFLVICGVMVGILIPSFRWISVLAISTFLYVLSLFGWFALNYFGYVQVEELLNVYSHELVGTWLGMLTFFWASFTSVRYFAVGLFRRAAAEELNVISASRLDKTLIQPIS